MDPDPVLIFTLVPTHIPLETFAICFLFHCFGFGQQEEIRNWSIVSLLTFYVVLSFSFSLSVIHSIHSFHLY